DIAVQDNRLELRSPKKFVDLKGNNQLNFAFKWCDNMQEPGNIMDFYLNGDVAPGGRFNFVYCAR
ncbi:MAG: hypothetical protein LWW85_11025, partial [Marinilabiliales bacterium]|nr:hypothetical protein [Marinilabiliales bacterium]